MLGLLVAAWVGVWARYVRPATRAVAALRAKLAADRAAVVSSFAVPEGDEATPARRAAERRAWWAREGEGSRIRFEALARAVSHALDRGEADAEWLDAEGQADVARWRDAGGLPPTAEALRWIAVVHGADGDQFEVALGKRVLAFRRTGGAAFTCWRVRAAG